MYVGFSHGDGVNDILVGIVIEQLCIPSKVNLFMKDSYIHNCCENRYGRAKR